MIRTIGGRRIGSWLFITLFASLLATSGSCAARPPAANAERAVPRQGAGGDIARVITAAEIARSGARTAWEAVIRAHVHLSASRAPDGSSQLGRRGQRGVRTRPTPVVILDGVRIEEPSVLHLLSASQVDRILVLTGPEATLRYGTGADAGAIVVDSRR